MIGQISLKRPKTTPLAYKLKFCGHCSKHLENDFQPVNMITSLIHSLHDPIVIQSLHEHRLRKLQKTFYFFSFKKCMIKILCDLSFILFLWHNPLSSMQLPLTSLCIGCITLQPPNKELLLNQKHIPLYNANYSGGLIWLHKIYDHFIKRHKISAPHPAPSWAPPWLRTTALRNLYGIWDNIQRHGISAGVSNEKNKTKDRRKRSNGKLCYCVKKKKNPYAS